MKKVTIASSWISLERNILNYSECPDLLNILLSAKEISSSIKEIKLYCYMPSKTPECIEKYYRKNRKKIVLLTCIGNEQQMSKQQTTFRN